MGIYSEEYVAVLHEAADSIIDKHKLKGAKLDHFVNGVYMLEYAFRRGLGKRDDIHRQFEHMASFESCAKAIDPLMDLKSALLK